MLYGRGAVDMKGGLACMLAAALEHLTPSAAPVARWRSSITGDEEGAAINGTVEDAGLDARARRAASTIAWLGEPTNPPASAT